MGPWPGLAPTVPIPSPASGVFLLVIAGWLVSLCLHEFGHAYTAWRFGDHDAAARGYLTLNPLKYSNPMLSLGLPLLFIAMGGIGLPGGAVYLRTGFMTPRQRTQVNLAGPGANLVLGVLLLGATRWFSTRTMWCSGQGWHSWASCGSPPWCSTCFRSRDWMATRRWSHI